MSYFSVLTENDTPGWPNDLVIRNNFASGRAAEALATDDNVEGRVNNLFRGVR